MLCLACWCCPLALGQVMTRMGLNAMGDAIPRERRAAHTSAFKVIAGIFLLFFIATRALGFFIGYTYVNQVAAPLFYYSNGTDFNHFGYESYEDRSYYSEIMYDDGVYIDDRAHAYTYDGVADDPYLYSYADLPPEVLSALFAMSVARLVRDLLRFLFWFYMLVLLTRARAHVRRLYGIPNNCHGCEDCCCSFWLPCCTTLQIARHTADYDTYGASCCTETGLPLTAPEVV